MQVFSKQYQVWERESGNTFYFTEYDTLEELLLENHYGDFYITKGVKLEINELPIPNEGEKAK